MFSGSKLAHLNFVGDSIIGERVNLEAGSIIANYRNEWSNHDIKIRDDGRLFCIGIDKFGALVGDGARIGANSVIAPGALIEPDTVVGRLTLIDQCSALSA
jgi:bifunctional N-acetylglucosamine-1-phosphate-uridyltransferase/glucosamine-1-phosphate-acetyltransferase GlmU-like protein